MTELSNKLEPNLDINSRNKSKQKLNDEIKKEIKTVSEQSQDELKPINSPMSDE